MEQIQNNLHKTQIADNKIETPEVLISTQSTALPPVVTVDFSKPEIVANRIAQDVRTDWAQYNAYYSNLAFAF